MISTLSNSQYDLASRIITAIDILSHYDANALIYLITVIYEEFPALLCGPNVKIWKKAFTNDLFRLS